MEKCDYESSLDNLAFFPIQYPNLEKFYQDLKAINWIAQEISYGDDRQEWENLDNNTRTYIKFLLFLFAQLDGVVNENLIKNFKVKTSFIKECGFFYAAQEMNETTHNETYSHLIETFIRDPTEKRKGLNSIKHYPEIRKIADWAFEWMHIENPLLEQVIAFACIEGIIFSSAFAGIYWIKKRNILLGLCKANEWIARDEGIHVLFAIELYHTLTELVPEHQRLSRLDRARVVEIIKSAADTNMEFTRNAMHNDLVGLNADEMCSYVMCTADVICEKLGYGKIYNIPNQLDWMNIIALNNKSNFFETRVSEYAKNTDNDFTFDLDTPY